MHSLAFVFTDFSLIRRFSTEVRFSMEVRLFQEKMAVAAVEQHDFKAMQRARANGTPTGRLRYN